jgi:hypothetical protein
MNVLDVSHTFSHTPYIRRVSADTNACKEVSKGLSTLDSSSYYPSVGDEASKPETKWELDRGTRTAFPSMTRFLNLPQLRVSW